MKRSINFQLPPPSGLDQSQKLAIATKFICASCGGAQQGYCQKDWQGSFEKGLGAPLQGFGVDIR